MDHTPTNVPTDKDAKAALELLGLDPTSWEDDMLFRRMWLLWPSVRMAALQKKRADRET